MYTDEEICDLIFDLSLTGQSSAKDGEGNFPHIRINSISPERKDRERAYMMGVLPGDVKADGPLQGKANSQAKAITNSLKLIRRSIAVVEHWGTGDHQTSRGISNPWKPFRERLILSGFSAKQILEIESRNRKS
jgi:hypothetical protein